MVDKKTGSNEVALNPNTGIAAPAFIGEDDFNDGFQGADADSFATPFIQVLQKMSPLVDEDDPKYVPGAKAGMFYDTVTKRLYDGKKGIVIIPAAYKRSFILWGGRGSDEGGFKGEFTVEQVEDMLANSPDQIKVLDGKFYVPNEKGEIDVKKSPYYADTRSHYVIVVDEESGESFGAVMSLSSSMIKSSKMLLTSLKQKKVQTPKGPQTPPTFANMVRATTTGMSNEKGTWSGVSFEIIGLVKDVNLYNEAKAMFKAFVGGEIKTDFSKMDATHDDSESNGKPQDSEQF